MEYTTKTIDELCEKITDGAHNSPEECIDGPYPMYSSKDMLYGGFSDSDVKRISDQDYEKLVAQDCQPQKNDILIIKDGANYLKYAFKIPERLDAVILSSIAILRPNTKIIVPDYFTYLLRTDSIRRAMSNFVSGAAIPRIVLKDFKRMKLRFVTDINCQREIAKILLSYDNLIEVNNKRIKVLEQMAENLYKEWFVRFRFPGYEPAEFENGIPKGWGIDSVKETFEIFDTIRIPLSSIERDNMQKVYPYYGAAEILDYVEDYLFDGIYLLLGEDGSVMTPDGKPMLQYVWGQFWVNNHAHVLQGKLPFTTEFIYLMFKNTNVTGIVTGSAQPKISQGRLFKKKTIIPPSHIVEQFNRIITPLFDNIRSLSEINKNLIKQRDLLLPRLMSGKLEV